MIVIGGGAAGLTAAGMSSLLGAKTALIERHRLGGDCTWTGCIPSKSLIHASKIPTPDFVSVMERVRTIRRRVYEEADSPPNMERLGVEVIPDEARFTDSHTVELASGRRLTSRYFVIATGSRPRTLAAPVPVYTNETIFEINALPARLAVIGAGPVGIELAQAFRRLGSEVTVIGSSTSILPRDDAELTAILRSTLESEGIRFQLGQTLDDDLSATEADAVLAAIGREPVTDGLQLEKAAIAFDPDGIRIDRHCRTSRRHIYAVGDVTGRFLFTHMAEHMAKVAVTNAILHWPRKLDSAHVAWCTFTDPELAHVGASEDDLKKDRTRFDVYRFPFSRLDRALTDDATTGMVKIMAAPTGRILGASILGARAGELISEVALAMKHEVGLGQFADTIHPYPTYSLAVRRAAEEWQLRRLTRRSVGLLQTVFRYRGRNGHPRYDNV